MFYYVHKITQFLLIAFLITTPLMAGQLECEITGRYRLDPIELEELGGHYGSGLTKVLSAPKGMHLELIEAQATYTMDEGEKGTYHKVVLKLSAADEPMACIASRNDLGIYTQNAGNTKTMSTRGKSFKGVMDFATVFVVPDSVSKPDVTVFLDRQKEGHSVECPQLAVTGGPAKLQIGQVKVVNVKYQDTYARDAIVSHRPKQTVPCVWTPANGQFMIVKIQMSFNDTIPQKYSSFLFFPRYFALEYPGGKRIRSVGATTPWNLGDEKYPMNKGLGKNEKWGDATWSTDLVFVVEKPADKFKVLFLPQE